MTFGIYTCCNSRMLPFFQSWRGAVERFNPGIPVGIIPFDEDSQDLRRIALDAGYHWVDGPARAWRELGRSVYGTSEYRHGSPRAYYFSKLAAFSGPFDRFVFADANSLVLWNVAREFGQMELDGCYFWYRANPNRNYRSPAALGTYRMLDSGFEHGFNASFFVAARNYVTLEMAESALCRAEYHDRLFGPAPEQSMLSWIKVTHGLKYARIWEINKHLRAGSRRADVRWCEGRVVNAAGRRVHFMKWSGQRFDESLPNFWLLRAMAENSLPTDICH
jgi:hypothetical protein